MVTAKKFVLVQQFHGEPKASDVKIVEEILPLIKDGEVLVQAQYLSVDPYMRAYANKLAPNTTMIGRQVGCIIESKNPNYPVGKIIVGYFGWQTHTIVDMTSIEGEAPYILPDLDDFPISLGIGVLGRTGNTAYFGFLEICKPKAGETLVVSGAAGAVGSHVGQIGKILGMKVIGIAGSDEKCEWIKNVCGFDHAINYKTQNVGQEIKKFAPNGVDCYFDNVGGNISTSVIVHMNIFGRVSVCGSISSYNADTNEMPKTSVLQLYIVSKQLRIEGFNVSRWTDRWLEGIEKNLQWLQEGKLVYHETITEGFDNMFTAFLDMMKGKNIGKAIVKV